MSIFQNLCFCFFVIAFIIYAAQCWIYEDKIKKLEAEVKRLRENLAETMKYLWFENGEESSDDPE